MSGSVRPKGHAFMASALRSQLTGPVWEISFGIPRFIFGHIGQNVTMSSANAIALREIPSMARDEAATRDLFEKQALLPTSHKLVGDDSCQMGIRNSAPAKEFRKKC